VLDDLEKTIGRTDNDGGVTMRIVARMLTWMSESRAPNMTLATANDLESMGELADIITRRGRLDRIFFVDVPHRRARQALFERLLSPLGAKEMDFEELAARSERFSGADIEGVVRDARAEAAANKKPVTMPDLLEQIRRHRVRALASYERFSRVRQWARLNAEMAGPGDESE
jgi:SpoVK/Ycf46/Vps4 family AAA+-type ATPase